MQTVDGREAGNAAVLFRTIRCVLLIVALMLFFPYAAFATFSIAACDEEKNCGVAVATNNLAVGASVIYARARVGCLASQFETNPAYGPKGLSLLASGKTPQATLDELLRTDGDFDGEDIAYRQVGIVRADGKSTAYTGRQAAASAWAGSLTGPAYSIQGNGLAGRLVIEAMRAAFLRKRGPLAERLMRALAAGQAAGGQTTGRLSAALLVRTVAGGWQDIDLRVDAADQPIPNLRRLLDMHYANDDLVRAERAAHAGRREDAQADMSDAIRLASEWDRVWRRVARLEMQLGHQDQAVQALSAFMHLNPIWARIEIEDAIYASLRTNPAMVRWRTASAAP